MLYINMNKSILIYENNKYKDLFSINQLKKWKGNILDVYFSKVYNPPFYKVIIYTNPESEEFVRKAWNITLVNGYLIIPEKYSKYLESNNYKKIKIKSENFVIYHKTNYRLYIFYDNYRVVDFMIIGVEKSGTTSAMVNLSKHPDIFIAEPKHHPGGEMHYYNMHWPKGEKWYKSFFDYKYKMIGEKNPNIIYLNYIYPYIQKINPCVKMILFLRNPIDRAYSAWHLFQVRNKQYILNENRKTFKEAIDDELEFRLNEPLNPYVSYSHYLQKGLYYKQITNLLKYFPKQNLCIILLEDLEKDPKSVYNKMYDFLEVKKINMNYEKKLEGIYTNKEKNKAITPELKKTMINFFKNDVEKLEKLLKVKTNWLS